VNHGQPPEPDRALQELIRLNLTLTLGREGYDIDTASRADEACRLLDGRHSDLVLTDLDLPDGSGLDVLRHAREVDAHVRAIVLTASTERVGAGSLAGAPVVLLKPFKLVELVEQVRKALGPGEAGSPSAALAG